MPQWKLFGRSTGKLLLASAAITLGFAGCRQAAAPPPDDTAISSALQARLSGDDALSSEPIQTSVQNGVATLNGNVSSQAARSLAANDAAQVAGVRTVINNLSVQTAVATPSPSPAPMAPPEAPPVKPISKKSEAKIPKTPKSRTAPAPAAQQAQVEQPAPIVRSPAPPPPAPAPPPPPAFRNVEVPSGTTLPVRITQTLDSATTQQGDTFKGTVANDVVVDGLVAIPHGSLVTGRVSAVQEAAHFKGNSLLTIELTSISRQGQNIPVTSEPFSKEGNGRGKNTATKVGGGAAVGAILGGIFGGGKGAAIGAASGGGLGAGANAITRGQQVQIPSETLIRFRTSNAVSVRASTSDRRAQDSAPEDGGQRRPMPPPNQMDPPNQ